jgi:hypothetical protein
VTPGSNLPPTGTANHEMGGTVNDIVAARQLGVDHEGSAVSLPVQHLGQPLHGVGTGGGKHSGVLRHLLEQLQEAATGTAFALVEPKDEAQLAEFFGAEVFEGGE